MEKIIWILIIVFAIMSVMLVLQSLGFFKNFDKKYDNPYKSKKAPNSITEYLTILNSNFNESAKSEAIISLLKSDSYFYVQILGNEGNNYDDLTQSKKFEQLLSPSAIENLKKLEGKNGQYSF